MSILTTKDDKSERLNALKKQVETSGEVKTLNLLIDAELLKKFKGKAALDGVTMTDVIISAIKKYLTTVKQGR